MCRWLAYSGSPLLLEELIFKPQHSLIDQSLHSKLGAETTNGDGFGIGWYGDGDTPGVFHSVEPAWNDRNLRELGGAHRARRSSSPTSGRPPGTPIQQTNCHPFRHGRWLWMHNGGIDEFPRSSASSCSRSTRRCTRSIEGSTDSEVFFYLALTLGLEDDPPSAVARAVGLIEEVGGSTASSTRSR